MKTVRMTIKNMDFTQRESAGDQDLQVVLPSSMKRNTFISDFSMENNPTAMINKINSQKQNRSIVQMKKILFSMNFYMSLQ